MAMMTGPQILTTFKIFKNVPGPGSSLWMSVTIFRLHNSHTVLLPMTHRIQELSKKGRGAGVTK